MICQTAKIIKESFMGIGTAYRIGGDEFCVFCSNLDANDIDRLSSRLKKALKAYRRKDYAIEFSMGVQHYEEKTASMEDMLSLADSKMHYVKRNISF